MWSLLEYFPDSFLISVLDIGASLGERPPYQSLVDVGRASVIGFEPNTEECERLNNMYGAPHRFFPHFIGDGQDGIFYETNWMPTGSLFEPNTRLLEKFQNLAEWTTVVAKHPVKTMRLDDIAEITDVDFFKIDVQGSELSVFRNSLTALASTLVIQTEVEFVEVYKGQPMFADVDLFLRNAGFQFHAFRGVGSRAFKPFAPNGDPNAAMSQVLWSDALYVRDWMNLEGLTATKLQKYAVLAHDVLESYDLCHVILSKLDQMTGGKLAKNYVARLTGTTG